VLELLRFDDRRPARAEHTGASTSCEDGTVSTRTLLVLAAITGLAILAAGAVQILLAR